MNRRFLQLLGLLCLAGALASFYLLFSELKRPEPASLPGPALPAAPAAVTPPGVVTVSIADGGLTTQLDTTAPTVGEALWRAGYRLYRADEVVPALDAPVTPLLTITLRRSRPITVQADGHAVTTRTRRSTVDEALSEAGLALAGEDYSVPAAGQPLPPDGLIRVVRVREEILNTQTLIPFDTVYQARSDWEVDNVAQLRAGAGGVKSHRVRVRYEDGAEVGRVDEGQAVTTAPVARVIGYGTQIVVRTLDTADGPVEYWRAFTMYATSYAAKFLGRPPTSPYYGRTASGKTLTKGIVAVDRRYIPFGTRMYVPGYGFAEAADTGGGVKGRWIDLGFDDWNYEGWHQVVTVYFATPAPAPDQIVWIIPSTVP